MTIWDKLGIEYTQDIRTIREAYMEHAKEVHPEEHPEEFMELQKAYKQAVRMAKQHKSVLFDKTVEEVDSEESEAESEIKVIFKNVAQISAEDVLENTQSEETEVLVTSPYDYTSVELYNGPDEALINEFFWKFQQIYNCFYLRNKVAAWKYVMENSEFEELFGNADFIWELSMLVRQMEYINYDVWDYMIEWFAKHGQYAVTDEITFLLKKHRDAQAHSMVVDRPINAQVEIIERLVEQAEGKGISREKALRLEYFLPNYFRLKKQKDSGIWLEGVKVKDEGEGYTPNNVPNPVFVTFMFIVAIICMIASCVTS